MDENYIIDEISLIIVSRSWIRIGIIEPNHSGTEPLGTRTAGKRNCSNQNRGLGFG